jgi:hypothetical protein
MSKHTPGPWTVGGKYAHKTVLLNAKGESIATGWNNRAVHGAELEASLVLASAAPELFKALSELYALVRGEASSLLDDTRGGSDRVAMMCEDAIAKATGQ